MLWHPNTSMEHARQTLLSGPNVVLAFDTTGIRVESSHVIAVSVVPVAAAGMEAYWTLVAPAIGVEALQQSAQALAVNRLTPARIFAEGVPEAQIGPKLSESLRNVNVWGYPAAFQQGFARKLCVQLDRELHCAQAALCAVIGGKSGRKPLNSFTFMLDTEAAEGASQKIINAVQEGEPRCSVRARQTAWLLAQIAQGPDRIAALIYGASADDDLPVESVAGD